MQPSIQSVARQWLTVVAVLMAIAVNALSNFFPPAGQNIGEISNTTLANVLITPEGYAFAIWGLIYLGLITFSIYQALPAQRHNPAIASIAKWLMGACLLQMFWVYLFLLSRFWLSVILMLGILACLTKAYLWSRQVKPTRAGRWCVQAPISIYFGWITVASVVNISGALLVSTPSDGSALSTGAIAWTIAMMLISGGLAATVALTYEDASYPAVAVWALSAIANRQVSIIPIAFVGIGLAIGLALIVLKIKTKKLMSTSSLD